MILVCIFHMRSQHTHCGAQVGSGYNNQVNQASNYGTVLLYYCTLDELFPFLTLDIVEYGTRPCFRLPHAGWIEYLIYHDFFLQLDDFMMVRPTDRYTEKSSWDTQFFSDRHIFPACLSSHISWIDFEKISTGYLRNKPPPSLDSKIYRGLISVHAYRVLQITSSWRYASYSQGPSVRVYFYAFSVRSSIVWCHCAGSLASLQTIIFQLPVRDGILKINTTRSLSPLSINTSHKFNCREIRNRGELHLITSTILVVT